MLKYLIMPVLVVVACNSKQQQDITQICKPGFRPKSSELKIQNTASIAITDPRTVTLLPGDFTSSSFPEMKSVADSALHIASVLLSSTDFKTAISDLDFTCRNYSSYCRQFCSKCSDRFSGRIVLDSVYREKQVKLDLLLNDCKDEFGHAARNIRRIYSCQPVVFYDEKKLTPAYCYAYHLAHEYMHIVGFFHTDYVDDVAEKTGWLGWEILLRWHEAGINVMLLRPGGQ